MSKPLRPMLLITAGYFVAAVELDADGTVITAAPIICYMRGWPRLRVEAYCAKKRWACQEI